MITLNELTDEVIQIQRLIDSLEVRGGKNASILAVAYEHCDSLIHNLKDALQEIQNESKKVGEENAEIDTRPA